MTARVAALVPAPAFRRTVQFMFAARPHASFSPWIGPSVGLPRGPGANTGDAAHAGGLPDGAGTHELQAEDEGLHHSEKEEMNEPATEECLNSLELLNCRPKARGYATPRKKRRTSRPTCRRSPKEGERPATGGAVHGSTTSFSQRRGRPDPLPPRICYRSPLRWSLFYMIGVHVYAKRSDNVK